MAELNMIINAKSDNKRIITTHFIVSTALMDSLVKASIARTIAS